MHPYRKGVTVTNVHEGTRFDDPFFQERGIRKEDFERIAAMGFDHVRLLLDHTKLTGTKDRALTLKEEGWRRLDTVLDWAKDCGLRAVLALRSAPGYCYRDAENVRDSANTLFFFPCQWEMFPALWMNFAERYAGTEDRIAFELLDRVGFALAFNNILQKGCGWEYLAGKTVSALRERSVARHIIIGTDSFGSCDGLASIPYFPDDPNIIYAFQFFKPDLFTRQAAFNHRVISDYFSLNHNIKSELIRYPGIIPGLDLFLEKFPAYRQTMDHYRNIVVNDDILEQIDFAPVRTFQKQHPQAELYASSFAAVMYADPESRKNYLSCVVRLFENAGIGHCYYKYLGSRWGLVDILQEEETDDTALTAIFPRRRTSR